MRTILFLSLLWWLVLFFLGSEHATLSRKTSDNASMISSAWIFMHEGLGMYGHPAAEFTGGYGAAESFDKKWLLDLQDDVFFKDRHRPEQAEYLVWPNAPRPYPVGFFLVYVPMAYLAYGLDLGFKTPLWIMAFVLILLAHVGFFKFREEFLVIYSASSRKWIWFHRLILLIVYFESLQWAMEGQLEVILLWPICAFVKSLRKKELECAVQAWATAFFFHLHAVIYLPLLSFKFFSFLKNKSKRIRLKSVGVKSWPTLVIVLVMVALSMGCLLLSLKPYAGGELTSANPWFWKNLNYLLLSKQIKLFVGVSVVCGLLLYARNFEALVVFFSMIGIFILSSHLKGWYLMAILPLLLVGSERTNKKWSLIGLFIGYVFLAGTFLGNSPFEFYFIRELFNVAS